MTDEYIINTSYGKVKCEIKYTFAEMSYNEFLERITEGIKIHNKYLAKKWREKALQTKE